MVFRAFLQAYCTANLKAVESISYFKKTSLDKKIIGKIFTYKTCNQFSIVILHEVTSSLVALLN
jgi:hypothetical protein